MSGKIYFIGHGGSKTMKVGYTSGNPYARMAALQTGSPDRLYMMGWVEGTLSDERELHDRFAHLRVSGEWFRFEAELEEFYDARVHLPSMAQ